MNFLATALLFLALDPNPQGCGIPYQAEDAVNDKNVVEPQLTIRQDGDDLVVSTNILSSGIGHVVLTRYTIDGKKVATLHYTLIQSEEHARLDCLASVNVVWRLKNTKVGDVTFNVQGKELTFSMAELKQLSEQLKQLLAKR
jgi:hypothetical protein